MADAESLESVLCKMAIEYLGAPDDLSTYTWESVKASPLEDATDLVIGEEWVEPAGELKAFGQRWRIGWNSKIGFVAYGPVDPDED
jgi:hypothetical protein